MDHSRQEEALAAGGTLDLRSNTIVMPDVGEAISLDELREEWARHGMPEVMLAKLALLRSRYAAVRRVKGDGNCFYRALTIGWLETLLASPPQRQQRVWEHLLPSVTAEALASDALPEAARAEFAKLGETFAARVKHVCTARPALGQRDLLAEVKGPAAVAKMRWLRLVASSYMRRHSEDYEAVAVGLGKESFDRFVSEDVEVMGVEADEPQAQALAAALGVRVRIEYLDGTASAHSARCGHVICGPAPPAAPDGGASTEETRAGEGGEGGGGDDGGGGAAPYLAACLLFRPGHYDVLIPAPSDEAARPAIATAADSAASPASAPAKGLDVSGAPDVAGAEGAPGAPGKVAESCAAPPAPSAGLQQLLDMGFERGQAEAALAQAGGDAQAAVGLLF